MHANAETAKCAQAMLSALRDSEGFGDKTSENEVKQAETQMIGQLRLTGILHGTESAFVEHACLEHGVVHIHAIGPGSQGRWIEVSPKTGDVSYF